MKNKGFTIVELLIVIVVIGILAAITIVAYNGLQQRARDSERKSELAIIERYVKMYIADNGTPPSTASGCYHARSNVLSGCESMNSLPNIATYLTTAQLPTDPRNDTTYRYIYARGMKKSADGLSIVGGTATDYVIFGSLENSTNPTFLFTSDSYNYIHASS